MPHPGQLPPDGERSRLIDEPPYQPGPGIRRGKRSMSLSWSSFPDRRYTIEVSTDLKKFEVLEKGIKATTPMNELNLPASRGTGPTFYRVLLDQ